MNGASSPNARRLLAVGFFAIFAAGVGFAVRGGVLHIWARDYGFTQAELGGISGGGLWPFGLVIIAGSLIADKIGYKTIMVLAFLSHLGSGVLQLCTNQIYLGFGGGDEGRFWVMQALTAALVLFGVGNGLCEVAVNPMTATLFPNNKTHYLNILHAGWPGGLVVGGLLSYVMNEVFDAHWMIQMSMFLIPVVFYFVLMLGQRMPRSEASEAGVGLLSMLAEFAAPMFLLLLLIHAMVGYVELGSDNWMIDILNRVLQGNRGTLLFTYTSGLMFLLRFMAGPIAHRLSPLGLLFISAVIAAMGLTLFGFATAGLVFMAAATIYGIGKTFFWPTMLAVVSERFPRGGAVTLGTVGGIGMLSAGLLGAPGIGFEQDYFSAKRLAENSRSVYDRYVEPRPKLFPELIPIVETNVLDPQKTGLLDLYQTLEKQKLDSKRREQLERDYQRTLKKNTELAAWWKVNEPDAKAAEEPIRQAKVYGGQMAFRLTALVPATMAVLYLLLILYFRFTGGYKRLAVNSAGHV